MEPLAMVSIYQEGSVGGGDGAVRLDEGGLQLGELLGGRHADTVVLVHHAVLAVHCTYVEKIVAINKT